VRLEIFSFFSFDIAHTIFEMLPTPDANTVLCGCEVSDVRWGSLRLAGALAKPVSDGKCVVPSGRALSLLANWRIMDAEYMTVLSEHELNK
jgi:hypothetical protein